jgi:anti-anti-sigma factor
VRTEGTFAVDETVDPDGSVRLSLLGELDHIASDGLLARLNHWKAAGDPVRLDLSRLQFIDSSGVRTILVSVREARSRSWLLEVMPQVSWQVQQVFDVLGVGAVLWPEQEASG